MTETEATLQAQQPQQNEHMTDSETNLETQTIVPDTSMNRQKGPNYYQQVLQNIFVLLFLVSCFLFFYGTQQEQSTAYVPIQQSFDVNSTHESNGPSLQQEILGYIRNADSQLGGTGVPREVEFIQAKSSKQSQCAV